MSVRLKLALIIAAVALAPLAISGVLAMQVHQRAFDGKVAELHARIAENGATRAQAFLDGALKSVQLLVTRSIRWPELSGAERAGALALVYRQHPGIVVAALLDDQGAGIGSSVFRQADAGAELADHPVATMEELSAFSNHIPFAAAKSKGWAAGEPFFAEHTPILPIALATDGARGQRWVVTLGFSLRALCAELAQDRADEIQTLLVDGGGRVLCGPHPQAMVGPDPELLTATNSLANGWKIWTQQRRSVAFAASRELRLLNLLLIAVSLVVAVAAGLLLARRINQPVAALVRGADLLAAGQLGHQITIAGNDELGRLGAAFNRMSGEIQKRDGEIRAFNAELQARVDERTRELKEAQAQLLQSQKIAAVSSLGAGIAHEINNPLTSVLGFAQILASRARKEGRDKDAEALQLIDDEAQRIKRIVATLLSFSESFAGEGFTELDANQLVEAALRQVPLGQIELVRELAAELPPIIGSSAQLQEAIIQLLRNALIAMRGAGRLTLRSAGADGVVRLEVIDTGKGIAPEHLEKVFDPFFTTKDDWRGEGLGLTIVHRIVEQHHGRVKAASRVGEGSTFTLILPVASRRAHLS